MRGLQRAGDLAFTWTRDTTENTVCWQPAARTVQRL